VADAGNEGTRRIPYDAGAERAVLGAVLLNPDSLGRAQEAGLKEDDFHREPHRLIYRAYAELLRAGEPIDLVSVAARLQAGAHMEAVGGYSYLTGLAGSTPSVAHLPHYVKVVRECALMRSLLSVTTEIQEMVYDGEIAAQQALESAEEAIFHLGKFRTSRSLVNLGGIVEHVLEDLKQRYENPTEVIGLTTGFRDLDRVLAGLQRTDLIIVAARPSMGKTAFSLNMCANAALKGGARVAFFSLEMGNEQLASRLLASEARVGGGRVRTGRLREDDWPAIYQAGEKLYGAPIHLDDTPGITLQELRGKCRRLQAERGLDLVIVDYLQLMRGTGREQSREQEISGISRGLKGLAKELDIPVVALSQLNRGVESRSDKRPMMSDLRESGAIEQDADVIMFLYRDEVYNSETEDKGIGEVLIRKQRNGSIGEVRLAWRAEFTRFENLARDDR